MKHVVLTLYNTNNPDELLELEWPVESCKVPGLCIHKMHGKSEDGKFIPFERSPGRYWWTITHVSSGIAVIEMIQTKADALELASQIKDLDWAVSADEIKNNPAYGKRIKEMAGTYYAIWY
jgi:hypothetical protein